MSKRLALLSVLAVSTACSDLDRTIYEADAAFLTVRALYKQLGGLEPQDGRGWHSLRRKFATELRDQPMRSLCDLGGWRDPNTVVMCYQSSDEGHLREVLANRKTLAN